MVLQVGEAKSEKAAAEVDFISITAAKRFSKACRLVRDRSLREKREEIHARAIARSDSSRSQAHVERSEEHTSELQSRPHLVCRLLLEKKKNLRHICT